MKYNFKVGDKVQIYRKPVSGLGVSVSYLPTIGAEGVVSLSSVNNHTIEGRNVPYVRIRFDDEDDNFNDTFDWAIPCSCLKRIKKETIIKVPAKSDEDNLALCVSKSEKICHYWDGPTDCVDKQRFPTCSEEQIVWLKVKR